MSKARELLRALGCHRRRRRRTTRAVSDREFSNKPCEQAAKPFKFDDMKLDIMQKFGVLSLVLCGDVVMPATAAPALARCHEAV